MVRFALSIFFLVFFALTPLLASEDSTEAVDKIADIITLFVIVVVPFVIIFVFWELHILPEKIAEKRHHPNAEAIKVVCLLSLVFGGMLWPFAWLWAYTKPTGYKIAYGTDKADSFFLEALEKLEKNELSSQEIKEIYSELENLSRKNLLSPKLVGVFDTFAQHIKTKEA